MNETDYNARLYEKMKADWQEDGVKVSKGAKSLSILEPWSTPMGVHRRQLRRVSLSRRQ